MSYKEPSTKPCRFCKRNFVPESLAKHQKVCQNSTKTRKVFDSSKQRASEDISLRQIKAAQKKPPPKQKSHWRQKHEEFINNIRSAKGAQIAMERGDPLPPPPPPSLNPDYVSCPYCARRFNEKAAERHIGFCKEQQKRIGNKREPSAEEKARASARQTFQAPKLKGHSPATGTGGGYSSGAGGGYSSGTGGGSSSGTGRGSSSGAGGGYSGRTGAPARGSPAATKPGVGAGRAPGATNSYGTSSAGRAPAGSTGTRGRPAPSNERSTYQTRDFNDVIGDGGFEGEEGYGNGRLYRGGRDTQSYDDMKAPSSMPRTKATPLRGGMHGKRMDSGHRRGLGDTDSGYYGNSSEKLGGIKMKSNGKSTPKFCYECGGKYQTETAKFCSECGIRRTAVS